MFPDQSCKMDGCNNKPMQIGGFCPSHVPTRLCKKDGCDKPMSSGGFCGEHGPRCEKDGCNKVVRSGGFCRKHVVPSKIDGWDTVVHVHTNGPADLIITLFASS